MGIHEDEAMSQDSNHVKQIYQKKDSRGWRIAKQFVLGALVVLVAVALLQVALDLPHENELGLRGGLKIESGPSVKVFIGDKHVGTGSVELTWDDLLGTSEIQPLAVPINTVALSPSMEGLGGVTAKALTNDDSEIIWHQNGMKGSAQNLEPITLAWEQVLVRRQNGKLDLILVLDGEFQAQTNSWRRFLVPIRLRSSNAESSVYFSDRPSGGMSSASGGMIPRSKIGSSLWLRILSKHESPPDEFSDEIATNGLWTPGQQIMNNPKHRRVQFETIPNLKGTD